MYYCTLHKHTAVGHDLRHSGGFSDTFEGLHMRVGPDEVTID